MSDSRFDRARDLFIQGVRAFESGDAAAARASFEASLALVPGRPSTLVNLAATLIRLDEPEAALPLLDEALAQQADSTDAWAYRGAALADMGRLEEALACQERVLQAEPQHRASAFERAALLNLLDRHDEALAALDALLHIDAKHAPSWIEHGNTLHALHRDEEALRSYQRALKLDDSSADAWSHCGGVLKDLGRLDEATTAFRRAVALGQAQGGDTEVDVFMLASLIGKPGEAPPAAPLRYVQGLFDHYAKGFDAHLVKELGYQVPEALCALLPPDRHFSGVLDLGCGTGLCALPLAGRMGHIDGIDLAPRMLAAARERGLYRSLIEADIGAWLADCEEHYELVLAADVFIYVGALEVVFADVARVLDSGGLFASSVEESAHELELRTSSRYAHSESYLRRCAQAAGLQVIGVARGPLRLEQRQPIAGLYALFSRA
jgi:predicted TPR repeat methyltransferase